MRVDLRNLSHLESLYRYWTYVVANRLRISDENRQALQQRALQDLDVVGVSRAALAELIVGDEIEVSMPFTTEEENWAARVCPWESLLSLATKPLRRPDQHITVVRHLRRHPFRPSSILPPKRLLVVVSAPGKLEPFFQFGTEQDLIRQAFAPALDPKNIGFINDPTVDELSDAVAKMRPDVIHLAGIDAHQAAVLLRSPTDADQDGFMLRSADNQAIAVDATRLSYALTGGRQHRPKLVAINCYNSGARLAAIAVANGAGAAIGFQDTIDDLLAEQFFTILYSVWRELKFGNLLDSFTLARQQLSATSHSPRTGDVVLWTDTTFRARSREPMTPVVQAAARANRNAEPWLHAIASEVSRQRAGAGPPQATHPRSGAAAMPSGTKPAEERAESAPVERATAPIMSLRFEVDARDALNYSLLHNRRPIYRRFRVIARDMNALPIDIEIKVHLFAGDDSFCFRSSHRITAPLTDLHECIHLPLISPMLRGRRECIASALTSEIHHNGEVLHCTTNPLRLLPADEWTDTDEDRRWLPSFILPRDPAVQRVFEGAQNYLRALADDSNATFDGYQQANGAPETVDLQVRSLWCALLYDHPLAYINPPPTYTRDAQRIRTPSQMMEEKRGTCLDLALLFAASLEYLGIMPVMFLVHGHAFPGYWRHPDAQKTFSGFGNVNTDAIKTNASYGEKIREGWMVQGAGGLAEITRAIQYGGLVPVETTALTRRESFRAAQELGVRSLMTPWGFDAMVEIQRAREKGVTPLPLLHLDL